MIITLMGWKFCLYDLKETLNLLLYLSMKMSKKLFEIIAQVMAIPISEINDKSSPENIESWDSFNGLVLLDELENSFNIKFSLEEITDVKTVEDIKRHLKNQGVNLDE